jgi:phosphomannomutase
MQIGLIMMALAAKLAKENSTPAAYYASIVKNRAIKWLHYVRKDLTLYDERLLGAPLQNAKLEGIRKRDRTMDFFKTLVDDYKNGNSTLQELRARINRAAPAGVSAVFPDILTVAWIGDGPMFESADVRFIMRASGTDAVLRYYLEGTHEESLNGVLNLVTQLDIGQ